MYMYMLYSICMQTLYYGKIYSKILILIKIYVYKELNKLYMK